MAEKKTDGHRSPDRKSAKKKWIFGILLGFILLVVISFFFIFTHLDSIVKSAIEKYGSRATGTAVRVESVRIRLRQGRASIHGLTVGNPAGFKAAEAFSLGEIGIGISVRSVSEKVKIIDEIVVRAPEVFAEMNEERTLNLNVISGNLARSAPPAKEKADGTKTGRKRVNEGAEPRLIIRHLLFEDGRIHARLEFGGDRETILRLPTVEMRNLGAPNGSTPTQLTRQIIGELNRRAMAEVRKKAVSAASEKARDEAGTVLKKRIFKGF
jgi:hypothetical protein